MYRPIYLDHHATTPLDQRVLAAMMPYFTDRFGNPGSSHLYGWEAAAGVLQAREQIATTIGADPTEIIFTSGATESNNLAIKGVAEAYFSQGKHFITLVTEHRAVLDPLRYLETLGFSVTYLPVDTDGLVAMEALEQAIRSDTVMVSVMAANNEIGVLQSLGTIGAICKARKVLFHTDAAQGLGKIPLDVQHLGIDLMSFTAHKCYGPKGIGGLYVRSRNPRVALAAQVHGGGQERGMRSGTLYPAQIVGMATAILLSVEGLVAEQAYLTQLRQRLWEKIATVEGIYLNGHPECRLAGNLNVSVEGVEGNALIRGLQPHLAISSGSACSTAEPSPSHVLKALGRSDRLAAASVRFGLGRFNTAAEIDCAADCLKATVVALRQSSFPRQ